MLSNIIFHLYVYLYIYIYIYTHHMHTAHPIKGFNRHRLFSSRAPGLPSLRAIGAASRGHSSFSSKSPG